MTVTTRQREVYDYLCRYFEANRKAPTIAEIGKHVRLRSPASIHYILSGLEREGLIKRIPNISRGIEIVRELAPSSEQEIPLLGVVAAGQPIEAVLSNESVRVPREMIGRGRTYALRVKGDSMIGEHIQDDDIVIVESRQHAENGQTVVALINGNEATVKRFYNHGESVRLEPANPRYKPLVFEAPGEIAIQGVVKGLIRHYRS